MGQQYAVVGLGAFGMAIAREMARNGGEVVAVDRDIDRVERLKDEVAYAVRMDATDPKVLEAHALHQADVVIITIGDDFEAVVLIAVECIQLGAKRVMARAENATQKKILRAIGVTDILTPEEEVARQVSQRLINPEIVDLFRLSGGYRIVEVHAPERFWGKTLVELNIRERFNCNIIAIKRRVQPAEDDDDSDLAPDELLIPLPESALMEGDSLVLLGLAEDIEHLTS